MKPIQKTVRQEREKQAGKQPHFERKDRKSAVNSDRTFIFYITTTSNCSWL